MTKIFGGSPLGGAGKYGDQSSTSAAAATAQAATTVSNALVNAINDAMAANQLEAAAQAQIGTDAYASLKATADAAVAAAGAAMRAAEGQTAAVTAQTAATMAATSSTAALASVVTSAGSTIQAASAGVAAITAAVAQYVAPVLGPGQGVGGSANIGLGTATLPTIGSPARGSGVGNGVAPATAFATNVIVNLNAGTVVGNNGMQQLTTMVSNEMVQQLQRLGIRLNRQ
jgi:membrane protein involved in colicin uptake